MSVSKEVLTELERAWGDRNPLLVNRLKPGLSQAKINSRLKRMRVFGDTDILTALYIWHNGTTLDQEYVFSKKGIFPGPPFHFMHFDMAAADFLGFALPGLHQSMLAEAAGGYFPIFWNGVVSWIAVDIRPDQRNRVLFIEFEPVPRIWEAYSSAEEFFDDLIAANREGRTLTCFSRKEAVPPERPETPVELPPVAQQSDTAEFQPGGMQCFVSDGGPHILLPDSARDLWTGLGDNPDILNLLDPRTDYGRACQVKEPIGLLEVGGQQGLVLAGAPPMSGWMEGPIPGQVDLLVFESWTEEGPEDLAEAIVPKLKSSDFADTGLRWTVRGDGATLMSAADRPGNSAYGEVPVPVRSGTYKLLRARHKRRGEAFWLFRLAPATGK